MSVIEGSTATFTVDVISSTALNYQWQRNGQSIAGATASSYTTAPLSMADSGAQFSVIVSNSAGQAASRPALLTVIARLISPSITVQPISQQVIVGGSATFSVSATGSAPLAYQWRRNVVAIDGATGESYTTPPAQLGDAVAFYDVVVSNAAGSVSSYGAHLIVQPPAPQSVVQSIDPDLQSYLVALGSVSRQAGEQTVPAAGAATITVASYESAGSLPIRYDAGLQLDGFDHHQFIGGLSAPMQTLALDRHVQGSTAGFELDRYDGALTTSLSGASSKLAMEILIAPRSGFAAVGIGNWKYIGFEQRGFFAGFQTARGSFVLGQPTSDSVIANVTSGAYDGFAHGGLEFELLSLDRFEEFSSEAHVTYDAATHELTLTLEDFETYEGSINTRSLSSGWPVPIEDPTTILSAGSTLSCVVTVDPSTNDFSCTLSRGGAEPAGTFKGKFYGPEGNEIAGTFALTGLVRFSVDDGVVGAIAVKRSQ